MGAAASARGESLWLKATTNERGLASGQTAYKVGDLLLITVDESVVSKNDLKLEMNKDTGVKDSVTTFLFDGFTKKIGLSGSGTLPKMEWKSDHDYKTSGKIDNSQTLTSSATVTVVDMLPNGNLVIEGTRVVGYEKERQFLVLRGIVRQEDITDENTVASTRIADARIEYISEGALSENQKKGWVTRAYDILSPY
tara:strand:+ start:74524 stop:75111 length:588 start_codon:yes stop_codon:yes gene_type:complete